MLFFSCVNDALSRSFAPGLCLKKKPSPAVVLKCQNCNNQCYQWFDLREKRKASLVKPWISPLLIGSVCFCERPLSAEWCVNAALWLVLLSVRRALDLRRSWLYEYPYYVTHIHNLLVSATSLGRMYKLLRQVEGKQMCPHLFMVITVTGWVSPWHPPPPRSLSLSFPSAGTGSTGRSCLQSDKEARGVS